MTTKNKTKLTSIVLCITLFISLFGAMNVSAANGDGTTGAVTWSLDANGVFTVSGEGAMEDYTSVDDVPWKDSLADITSVIIGESVTHVSDYGFYGAVNLTSVTFENEYLYRIGECTFYNCENLKTVTLPKGLKEIGYGAFGCDDANKGLETVYFPARNCSFGERYNEETYEGDNSATFPVHTVVYGYYGTNVAYYCERNFREFVAYETGYILNTNSGESTHALKRNSAYDIADLWKAVEAENGSSDSIEFDYSITIDADDAPEIFNYMVDYESYRMDENSYNDARLKVEVGFSFSGPSYSLGSLRETATYSFNETDIKGNENDDYLNWQSYGDSFITLTADGSVLTINFKGTLKDLYEELFPDGMDERLCEVGFSINVSGITSYHGPYNTVRDNLKQLEYASCPIYDAHDYYVDRVDKWALSFDNSFEVFTWSFVEGEEGFYDIIDEDYYWTYEFKKEEYYWDYDEETGEETEENRGGDVEYPTDGKTVSTEICSDGKEYGIAIGECSTGSKNYLTLRDILTDENRSFLESFVGLKPSGEGGPVYISWNCSATLTFEDGTKAVYDVSGGDEMMHLVAPCVHSCKVCGACTEKNRSLPCNFSYRQNEPLFVCSCDESAESDIVVENVSTTSATTANTEAPVTVVIDKVDMTTAADTAYVEHITQEIADYEVKSVYNVDIYDEYSGNPYILNQWGDSGEELTVTIPVSEENAQALSAGDATLYHIDGDGSADAVEGFEVVLNGENSSVTFTSNTFSPFVITGAEKETPNETSVTVTKDADANNCTVKYSITAEDFSKTPTLYIAFYTEKNALVAVSVLDDITCSDEFTVSVPSGSKKCKVILCNPTLAPLCVADYCEM
ncbi:MAG: leucine-rich repeat domain-containing protein [Clostridia bacterium]|nr:leucine-rich repeat domain-containing protein [Clostridia bacterium]